MDRTALHKAIKQGNDKLSRAELENIQIGQTGLYMWDRSLPVVSMEPVRRVVYGQTEGRAFRYISVASATGNATIGFIVDEAT